MTRTTRTTRTTRRRHPVWVLVRTAVVALVLGLMAVVVPGDGVRPADVALVRLEEGRAVDLGGAGSDGVVWILAVGSDARPGEDMLRTRGDALQLIGLDTSTGAATTIGVPRDSYVDIPGHGSDRVNAALFLGGPELLGRTVGGMVGVQPDYVFVTRFPFFEQMVHDIGGITVRNPRAFADDDLKDNGFPAGRIRLGGYDAMAFARIRKELVGGDFDRSANQQIVLRGIQQQIARRSGEPGFLARGVQTVMEHLHTDLPPGELFRLATAVAQVDPARVTACVVPGGIGDVGGASVVIPSLERARSYGDQARDDATIERC